METFPAWVILNIQREIVNWRSRQEDGKVFSLKVNTCACKGLCAFFFYYYFFLLLSNSILYFLEGLPCHSYFPLLHWLGYYVTWMYMKKICNCKTQGGPKHSRRLAAWESMRIGEMDICVQMQTVEQSNYFNNLILQSLFVTLMYLCFNDIQWGSKICEKSYFFIYYHFVLEQIKNWELSKYE